MIALLRKLSLLLVLLWTGSVPACAEILEGYVSSVTDGDTISVRDDRDREYEVRLGAIDAPEGDQPFGDESRKSLSRLVQWRHVRVEYEGRDRYGRIVGKVWLHRGGCVGYIPQDINLAQIAAGMAWWYRHYAPGQSEADRAAYEHEESKMRASRLGLWSAPEPIPPWDWRRAVTRPLLWRERPEAQGDES
jgi:endonuclease YncB( thermonuclease family)